MGFTVHLRRNSDGLVRQIKQDGNWTGEDGHEFLWTEGNFGCDCNRHLFFERAAGDEPAWDDLECGQSAYTIVKVTNVLRHTAAVQMAEGGAPMSEIAAVLGHSDSRITERVYAKYSPGYLAKAVGKIGWTVRPGAE